jgi:hypothetical protein
MAVKDLSNILNMMCYYISTSEFKRLAMNIFQVGIFRIFSKNLQKFEICKSYILLISWSENIFKGIFLLRGSRRMGKSCQHILLYFLVHPNVPYFDTSEKKNFKRGIFFFKNCIQHCFICRPSDSTVSEDAGIELRTVNDYGIDFQTL